jgi:carboxy-cis,cis-muconate cyclase
LRAILTPNPTVLVEKSPSLYRSDVCTVTPSGKFLFATSRSNKPGIPGYISAFSLLPSGAIEKQLSLQSTTTSGGHSNAVSFSEKSDEWIALTDDEVGFIEIYRWDGEWLARVARCEVKEPGFGMNAVWFN